MQSITYNDIQFQVVPNGAAWDITYQLAKGGSAVAGTGLFAGIPEGEASTRALALIKTIFPVGVRSVGPDVNHPHRIGDLKIVGPDVTHPNFIYWTKDTTSCPKTP